VKEEVMALELQDYDRGLIALRNNSIPACFSPKEYFYSYYGNRHPLLEVFLFGSRSQEKGR
jgi:hypothetical protein